MACILVVDHDEILAEQTAQTLIDAGFGCGWVSSTIAAMIAVRRRRPDLILLEQNMPGEKGLALLRRLRNSQRYYDVPVAVIATSTGQSDEEIAYFCGAQDFIKRPCSDRALVSRAAQVLLKGEECFRTAPPAYVVNPRGPGGQVMAMRAM